MAAGEKSINDISPRISYRYMSGWSVMSKGGQCGITPCIPDHDIQFIYQGSGSVVIDGVDYTVKRGDLITIFPGESFYEKAGGDSPFARYFIHFDFFSHPDECTLTPLIDGQNRWPRLIHLDDEVPVREICMDILTLRRAPESSPLHHILDGKVHTLIGIIMSQYLGISVDSAQQLECRRSIFKVEHYIRQNYMDDMNIEHLAEMAGLSPCYFGSIFKKAIGRSPKDYLIDYRLKKAKQLLIETGHNISEVAAMVGYKDAAYFSNLFKQREGISPSRFASRFSIDEKYTG
jgi:AraC-like DNA-binding protein